MGLLSQVDKSSLVAGDHIYGYRNAHAYTHHGIYVGDNRVIQFTRTEEPETPNHVITTCRDCNYNRMNDRGVVKCCLDCFLDGHALHRFHYGVSHSRFYLKKSGTCSTGECSYSQDEVVKRATEILNSDEGFGDYDVMDNNCETFAKYCTTGKRVSLQTFSLKRKGKILFEGMTSQPFSVKNTVKTSIHLVGRAKVDTLECDMTMHQNNGKIEIGFK